VFISSPATLPYLFTSFFPRLALYYLGVPNTALHQGTFAGQVAGGKVACMARRGFGVCRGFGYFCLFEYAVLQISWLALTERMLECPCCPAALSVYLGLWGLMEGLLVKVMAGLSGGKGKNTGAVKLP